MNKTRSKNFRVTMAYINIPKDLTKVKSKVALNLTKRQLICFSIAAAFGVPVYFLSRGALGVFHSSMCAFHSVPVSALAE